FVRAYCGQNRSARPRPHPYQVAVTKPTQPICCVVFYFNAQNVKSERPSLGMAFAHFFFVVPLYQKPCEPAHDAAVTLENLVSFLFGDQLLWQRLQMFSAPWHDFEQKVGTGRVVAPVQLLIIWVRRMPTFY